LPQARYKKQKNSFPREKAEKAQRIFSEGILILVGALALYLLLALFSYSPLDPGWSHTAVSKNVLNLGGYLGAICADILFCIFGYLAYLFPFLLAYAAWLPIKNNLKASEDDQAEEEAKTLFIFRFLGFTLILLAGSSLSNIYFHHAGLPFASGGIVGSMFYAALVNLLNPQGTVLILWAFFLAGFTMFTGISWLKIFIQLKNGFLWVTSLSANQLRALWDHYQERKAEREEIPTLDLMLSAKNDLPSKTKNSLAITEPTSIKSSQRIEKEKQIPLFEANGKDSLPPLSLLDHVENATGSNYTAKQLENLSRQVELRLEDFGIDAEVVAVHPGPVVTRFELQLAAGTKVSRVTNLAKDLARSLSVVSVRVVEIIPGKSVIGLELPNERREIVRLREILSSNQYEQARSPLTLALGKDISGNPVIVDLSKMPHLLVAGTTGSGKSVCLNALLLSFLYKYTPKEMRLILIDPKMLELSVYQNIPHLLAPVVTDMRQAANALRWSVMEMDRRYKIMVSLGVRNISGFNHKIREAAKKGTPILDPLWQEGDGEGPKELQELPYIVVIADEYADMIMVVGKKVEELIARISQKARAAGIHLILATQRPSVDVITGLIKANIPTRIAFQVSSKIDSRTILDQSGAEQLLGFGDMLYLPPGTGIPVRIHGAFVSDEEVHKVAKELKKHGQPEYVQEILEGNAEINALNNFDDPAEEGYVDAEKDPLYDQAVRVVTETRKASVSNIQRRLKIGYNRAARIVDSMEAAGIVSAMETNGSRIVLVAPPPDIETA
jgi:DNA segregation ATPase FtsK/SpoIIIE, S-DNA-T family